MEQSPKVVLLVDDDIDYIYQTKSVIEKAGYRVVSAQSMDETRQILGDLRPDLVVLDLMMEVMDAGFVLSYEIKKKDPAIPVIMATAVMHETGLEFDAATSEERNWVKADVVLTKPVRPEQLMREIHRLLGKSS
jgi:CheY-like chemotaxis protein